LNRTTPAETGIRTPCVVSGGKGTSPDPVRWFALELNPHLSGCGVGRTALNGVGRPAYAYLVNSLKPCLRRRFPKFAPFRSRSLPFGVVGRPAGGLSSNRPPRRTPGSSGLTPCRSVGRIPRIGTACRGVCQDSLIYGSILQSDTLIGIN
jgi:hypothetical protein